MPPEVIPTEFGGPLPGAELHWREWIRRNLRHVATHPFAQRHADLYDWYEALRPGFRPKTRVEVWPRGGAKSSTGEIGCARVGVRLTRRFALYVSGTQDQADKHVQSVASLFETLGVERAVNRYGHSKGWRRNQLRTANGFNVESLGLDVAVRGVKLGHYRPDLIIFDDIDSHEDTLRTIEKKINAITTAIIPAGSIDCAVLFLQNLIHEEGIVAQLVDGRADFLHDREAPVIQPAVEGLEVTTERQEDGSVLYRIIAGTPTWAGQDLATCEHQMNQWGFRAFDREAQHNVRGATGYVFDVTKINYVDAKDVPAGLRKCRAWDLAATEGGGDHTVGFLGGMEANGNFWVLDVDRGQWGSDNVRKHIRDCAEMDGSPSTVLRLPQDPGQAGKDQAEQFQMAFGRYRPKIQPVTGDKTTRATGLAECMNKGQVYFVRASWNAAVREVFRKFKEDELHQLDDDVDAGSDCYNELAPPRNVTRAEWLW